MEKERNLTLDIAKGIAILMVIIGHVLTNNVINFEKNIIFNIIWSLQMPLFMVISGFTTKYSKKIKAFIDLLKTILKRTVSYLLPWIVWTLLRRYLIFSNIDNYNFSAFFYYILFNMDAGYWFLFSLWTINVLYLISSYLSNKFKIKCTFLLTIMFMGLLSCLFAWLAIPFGVKFLAIKYTLYYILFYGLGYFWWNIVEILQNKKWFIKTKQIAIIPLLIIYSLIVCNHNLYLSSDSLINILIRVFTSICGIAIFFTFIVTIKNEKIINFFNHFGKNSLEYYVVHYFFIKTLFFTEKIVWNSIEGILISAISVIITIILSFIVVKVIDSNKYVKFICFGKK